MDNKEIALQLTLKAIDKGVIQYALSYGTDEETKRENSNLFSAKQITAFFNEILKNLEE